MWTLAGWHANLEVEVRTRDEISCNLCLVTSTTEYKEKEKLKKIERQEKEENNNK